MRRTAWPASFPASVVTAATAFVVVASLGLARGADEKAVDAKASKSAVIAPEDAKDHVGEKVTVAMTVARMGEAATLYFLNAGVDRDTNPLTLVMGKTVGARQFACRDLAALKRKFGGKLVHVTGTVYLFNELPNIRVEVARELVVVGGGEASVDEPPPGEPPPADDVVMPADALGHVDSKKTVEFVVEKVGGSRDGELFYLNAADRRFTTVLTKRGAETLDLTDLKSIVEKFEGKTVRATGKIYDNRGVASIRAFSAKQIEVFGPPAAAPAK
ncbi:MAG: hypothetical protein ACRC1K_10275 [Planctomycetia bacterium]